LKAANAAKIAQGEGLIQRLSNRRNSGSIVASQSVRNRGFIDVEVPHAALAGQLPFAHQ